MDSAVVAVSALAGLVLGEQLEPVVEQVPETRRLGLPLWACSRCQRGLPLRGLAAVPLARLVIWSRPCPACGAPRDHARRPIALALVTGLLFAAFGARLGAHLDLLAYDAMGLGLVAMSAIDLERMIVPVRVFYPTLVVTALLLGIASVVYGREGALWRAAVVGIASSALFFVIHVVQPRGMGFGDVRLAGLVGFSTGWLGDGWHAAARAGAAFLAAFVLGAVIGLGVMAATGGGRKTKIPFAPFLAAGGVVSVLFGSTIAHAWLGRFG
jgi:leader peptidase (prepilin peptidase)/N-methyltransferase